MRDYGQKSQDKKNGLWAIFAIIFMFTCSESIVDEAPPENVDVELSVHESGMKSADFTGKKINLIVNLSAPVYFRDISFQTGGLYIRPNIPANEAISQLILPIHWNSENLQLNNDSLSGFYFDTVYARVGMKNSNPVYITIKNRAPVIDSLYAGNTSFPVSSHIFSDNRFELDVDTTGRIELKVGAKDFDNNPLNASWRALRDSALISIPPRRSDFIKALYDVPEFNFRDSIMIDVYDGNFGNFELSLIVTKRTGNDLIYIKRLSYNSFNFSGLNPEDTLRALKFDGAILSIDYEYNTPDSMFVVWKSLNGMIKNIDNTVPPKGTKVKYIINDTTGNLLEDKEILVDRISVRVQCINGVMSERVLNLIKIPTNKRPIVDSVYGNKQALQKENGSHVITVGQNETVPFIVFARDPDSGGELTYDWESYTLKGKLSTQGESGNIYTALGKNYVDSLYFSVKDEKGFSARELIIIKVFSNTPADMDSVLIDNKIFVTKLAMDSVFSLVKLANDTFHIRAVGHDIDTIYGDNFKYSIKYRNENLIYVNSENNLIKYVSADSTYSDTIYLGVTDSYGMGDTIKAIITFTKQSYNE